MEWRGERRLGLFAPPEPCVIPPPHLSIPTLRPGAAFDYHNICCITQTAVSTSFAILSIFLLVSPWPTYDESSSLGPARPKFLCYRCSDMKVNVGFKICIQSTAFEERRK
jgi:hypothetical protein